MVRAGASGYCFFFFILSTMWTDDSVSAFGIETHLFRLRLLADSVWVWVFFSLLIHLFFGFEFRMTVCTPFIWIQFMNRIERSLFKRIRLQGTSVLLNLQNITLVSGLCFKNWIHFGNEWLMNFIQRRWSLCVCVCVYGVEIQICTFPQRKKMADYQIKQIVNQNHCVEYSNQSVCWLAF